MQVKFEKGSREWNFFAEFYKLVQKYYIVEPDTGAGYECYWKPLLEDFAKLGREYKDCGLLSKLCYSYVEACERILNERKNNNG